MNTIQYGIQLPPIFQQPLRRLLPSIPLPDMRTVVVSSVDSLGTIHPNIYASIFMFTFVTIFMYIKLKYPFWNGKPVYHTYDFWRRWYASPYIMHKLPMKTKYHQKQNVYTVITETLTVPQWQRITDFLQYFSIPSDRILYSITHTQFMSMYNAGHNHSSYLSVILPITENNFGENTEIFGVVASRSATITLPSFPPDTPIYYIDPLVLHRNHPTYIRTLFDTHVYRQRRMTPEVSVSVWKQEITPVEGVVPLVQFSVGTYYLGNILGRLPPLSPNFQLQRIQSHNISILTDCWRSPEFTAQFQCVLQTSPAAVLATTKSELTWVFALRRGEHVYALYYFKIPQLTYEAMGDGKGDGGETIQCVSTVCNCHDNLPLFYAGFLHCLGTMVKSRKTWQMLLIEWIGHTEYLGEFWRKDYSSPICQHNAGYYLYNMVVPSSPLVARNCFVFL